MAALNASNGGSTADDDGRVATCWRPVGPCTSRYFAAAWSAGGYGGTGRLTTACGTLELRFERGSNVAMRPSACGRMRLVPELLIGPQSPCMRPRSIPGAPFHSDRSDGPPWVLKGDRCHLGGLGDRTSRKLPNEHLMVSKYLAESRFWGVFIIAVHRAFVLGLGARHLGRYCGAVKKGSKLDLS